MHVYVCIVSWIEKKRRMSQRFFFFFFFWGGGGGGGESGERARETKDIYKELCREQASEIKREGKV